MWTWDVTDPDERRRVKAQLLTPAGDLREDVRILYVDRDGIGTVVKRNGIQITLWRSGRMLVTVSDSRTRKRQADAQRIADAGIVP